MKKKNLNESTTMRTTPIKALSFNCAWQVLRFKTPAYNSYIKEMLYRLPKLNIGKAPYSVSIEFGLKGKEFINFSIDNIVI